MPEPGWIPKETQPKGSSECMRLAVSCASGIHWRRLRFIDPNDYSINFAHEWDVLLWERGHYIQRASRAEAEASGHFWIATVDSFTIPGANHALVMKGDKLYYDSAQIKRKRAPTALRANPELVLPYA